MPYEIIPPAGRYEIIPPEPSLKDTVLQGAGNLAAGAIRGAGSIGATIMWPIDAATDMIQGDRGMTLQETAKKEAQGADYKRPLSRNEERRQAMDQALESLGAEPDSWMYKGGKLATEIAGTAGTGSVLANGVRALPLAGKVPQAIAAALESGGFRTGGELQRLADLAVRVGGGAATGGAAAGLANPADAVSGAAVGGVLPPAAKAAGAVFDRAAQAAKSLVQPFMESGQRQIVGNALVNAAGNQASDAVAQLRAAQELIPGSLPTAAEAAGNPGIASLQRAAISINPAATNELALRQAANNEARLSALSDIAGTQGKREFFDAARGDAANELYQRAFAVPLNAETLSQSQREEVSTLLKMPAVQDAIRQARTNALNAGQDIGTGEGSIAGLHQAKLAMDDQINKLLGGTAAEANKARAITSARDRLVSFMEDVSPAYGEARVTFQQMSKPINQMDIAQRVMDKSTSPLTGSLYPNALARNISDDTARSATGFNGATLQNTMTPDQLRTLEALRQDLQRKAFADSAGRAVGSNTVQNLAYTNMLDSVGVPTFLRTFAPAGIVGKVAGRGADLLYKRANEELADRLAMTLLDPAEAGILMQRSLQARPGILGRPAEAPMGILGKSVVRSLPLLAGQQ